MPYGIKIQKMQKSIYAFTFISSLGCFEICEISLAIWYNMSEKAPFQVIKTEKKKKPVWSIPLKFLHSDSPIYHL